MMFLDDKLNVYNKNYEYYQIPQDSVYRGEGNSSIVITLPRNRKILRIKKVEASHSLMRWIMTLIYNYLKSFFINNNNNNSEDLEFLFYQKIMRPLFGRNYVSEAQQVNLSKMQVYLLKRRIQGQRPANRKHKTMQHGRATIFNDFAFLPGDYLPFKLANDTYAIEIKPKQGWIPLIEQRYPKCLFCLHQHLKRLRNILGSKIINISLGCDFVNAPLGFKMFLNGQIKEITSYCPEDLFSGDEMRMNRAISALILNPQNNFKVFKNGSLFYDENYPFEKFVKFLREFFQRNSNFESLHNEFCSVIQKSLTTNFSTIKNNHNCSCGLFCNLTKRIQSRCNTTLPEGCVLEKILSVQMLDVEGSQYYYKLLDKSVRSQGIEYVKKFLRVVDKYEDTCIKCKIMLLSNIEESDKKNDLMFVPYLISSVANDCSLMVTLRKVDENINDTLGLKNIIESKYGNIVVNIGIFDLYPKPVSTISKHVKRNEKILEAYLQNTITQDIKEEKYAQLNNMDYASLLPSPLNKFSSIRESFYENFIIIKQKVS